MEGCRRGMLRRLSEVKVGAPGKAYRPTVEPWCPDLLPPCLPSSKCPLKLADVGFGNIWKAGHKVATWGPPCSPAECSLPSSCQRPILTVDRAAIAPSCVAQCVCQRSSCLGCARNSRHGWAVMPANLLAGSIMWVESAMGAHHSPGECIWG